MCRQFAISPGVKHKEALEIMKNFMDGNSDGTGFSWIDEKTGKFVIEKWPHPLEYLLDRKVPILSNLPHSGWVIGHLRSATGTSQNLKRNTHPFFVGDYSICHNGIFSDDKIVRLCLSKIAKFDGDCDSESAARLINLIGAKKFTEEMSYEGVYLCLNRKGDLEIAKTSGDLCLHRLKNNKLIISSEFDDDKYKNLEIPNGYYMFSPDGECLKSWEKKSSYSYYGGKTNYYDNIKNIKNHVWNKEKKANELETNKISEDGCLDSEWKYDGATNSFRNIHVDRRLPSCYRGYGMCE